jgi:hypothetical protein
VAYENPLGTNNLSIFEASTGLSQYQMVHLSTAGLLVNPTTLGEIIGVLVSSGTTGSTGLAGVTGSGSVQSVQVYGVAKVLAGSTALAPGNKFAASTVDGSAIAFSETNNAIGYILSDANSTGGDSTGGIGQQVISALLLHLGLNSTIA